MTQIASLLVVATIFTWLMVCKYLRFTVRGGLYVRQIPMQELELKMQGRWERAIIPPY